MREGWRATTIGGICTVISGQSPNGKNYNDVGNGLPFYQGKKDFGAKYIGVPRVWTTQITKEAKAGDILMSVRAPVGPINVSTEVACIGRGLAAIRAGDAVNREFLFYGLLNKQREISGNEGAVFPSINKKQIENIDFSLPPLPEQKRIVAILDEVFKGIDAAIANTEKNLANARELFTNRLSVIFTSPINAMRDGWEDPTLGEVAKIVSGGTPKSGIKEFWDGGILWITPKDMGALDDIRANETSRTISYQGLVKSSAKLVPVNSVILSTRAPIGHLVINDVEMAFNQGCRGLVPSEKLLTKFLFYFLKSNIDLLNELGTGATFKELAKGALESIVIPLPALSEQKRIVTELDQLSAESQRLGNAYRRKIVRFAELKQSMLHKAFSGELMPSVSVSNIVPFLRKIPDINTTDLHAGILAMAYQMHESNPRHKATFGGVKAEKIAHMVEAYVGIDLERKPVKDAAGPNDFQHLNKMIFRARRAKFFDMKKGTDDEYSFEKRGQFDKILEKTQKALGEDIEPVEYLISRMVSMNTQQAEIFATVYAAWNNLLIRREDVSDEAIVYEARENWHKNKCKIPRDKFFKAIEWMTEKNIIPKGKGKLVEDKGVS